VGKPHKLYEDLGASQFEDDIKEGGPVCGLFSALVNASLEWVCLCAADMPFVSLALIRYLYVQSMSKEVDIVLCKTDDTLQPFLHSIREILSLNSILIFKAVLTYPLDTLSKWKNISLFRRMI